MPATTVINGVTVDLGSETLRAADGTPRVLRPQSFATLRYLIENPNRLVTKDELMDAVWHEVAVTDDSLVQCIHEIRRAIGDETHAMLVNVPRRGYRLVIPEAAGVPQERSRRRRVVAAALVVAAAAALALGASSWRRTPPAAPPLVAVLPFEAVSEDASAARLAQGLTGDLITDLARFPEFAVLAAGTTSGYGGAADPRRVGAELGALFVIAGSIDRQADRVRVTARLTDVAGGSLLWSDRWERPADDVFAVQSEIAETIANRLGGGAGLVQETGRIAARRKPPRSLGAYELYLLGTERLERTTRPDVEAAIALLDRAVAIDPGFARAWIELSHSHGLLGWNFGVEPETNMAAGRTAAERALALDPGDPEAHIAVGKMAAFNGDLARTEVAFDTALRLAPNAAEILTFYAGWASSFGKAERGAEVADRAIRLEPNFPMWKVGMYAYAYFMAGRYAETLAMIARQEEKDYYKDTWAVRAGALAALGREAEAREVSGRAAAARPDVSLESLINDPLYSDAELRRSGSSWSPGRCCLGETRPSSPR
jgi:TolB-like protein/DNA-binding winged helix-turn-helix (wHTH) protein